MIRILAGAWGTESSAWIGKRVKLFFEPSVKYAGEDVGGAGDAFADCEEYYGSDFIGAYIELATDCAVMLVNESVCHDIMEDQF